MLIKILELLMWQNFVHRAKTFNEDHFVVAIVKADTILGHISHKFLLYLHVFMKPNVKVSSSSSSRCP